MSNQFRVERTQDAAAFVLRLQGELDVAGAERFEAALDHAVAEGADAITLDFAELRFLGSAALSTLLRVRSAIDSLTIQRCCASVRRTFETTGLDRFFVFVDG